MPVLNVSVQHVLGVEDVDFSMEGHNLFLIGGNIGGLREADSRPVTTHAGNWRPYDVGGNRELNYELL